MDKYSHLKTSHSWQKLVALLFVRQEAEMEWHYCPILYDLIKSVCNTRKFFVLPLDCFNTMCFVDNVRSYMSGP